MSTSNDHSDRQRDDMITLRVPRSALTALWTLGSLIALLLVALAFVAGLALRPAVPAAAPVQVPVVVDPASVVPSIVTLSPSPSPLPVTPAPPTSAPTSEPAVQPTLELIRPTEAPAIPAPAEAPVIPAPTEANVAPPAAVDFRIEPQPAAVQPPAAPVQAASAPLPAARPADSGGGGASRPAPTTRPPVHALRGNVRWLTANSPVIIENDLLVSSGASLIIEPGVEVQIGKGASLVIDGSIVALATPDRPVRFTQIGGGEDPRLRCCRNRCGWRLHCCRLGFNAKIDRRWRIGVCLGWRAYHRRFSWRRDCRRFGWADEIERWLDGRFVRGCTGWGGKSDRKGRG